jgi:hypothetical protein
MANEVGISEEYTLELAYQQIQQFFAPILTGRARGLQWKPESWSWK